MKTTMTTQEALCVLQIKERPVTRDRVKISYRRLAQRYHPDKNPNGLRLMQDVNVAYQYLSSVSDDELSADIYTDRSDPWSEYVKAVKVRREKELSTLKSYGLKVVRIEGGTYIEGKTYYHRELLKEMGFRWNAKYKVWRRREEQFD